jgi:hypothetical protein
VAVRSWKSLLTWSSPKEADQNRSGARTATNSPNSNTSRSQKKKLKDFPQARRGRDTPVDSKFQTQNENNRAWAWAFHSQFALPQPKTEPKKLLEFLPPRQTSYSKIPKIFIAA